MDILAAVYETTVLGCTHQGALLGERIVFTRFKARVTRAMASLTAVTMLAGTAAVGFAAPAAGATNDINSLTWGVKESFRNYVNGPIAKGQANLSGGAGAVEGIYGFPITSNNLAAATPSASFGGTVRFSGHSGKLDLRLANPKVVFNTAKAGKLYLDVKVHSFNGSEAVDVKAVEFANFSYSKSGSGSTAVYTATGVKLTAAGAKAFAGFYNAGDELDGFVLSGKSVKAASPAIKVTKKPTISGKAAFNSTLTAKKGTWNVSGASYKYQWLRDGKAIKGATKAKYKLKVADVGKQISVKVTASKSGHASGSSTTAKTKKVAKAAPTYSVKLAKSTATVTVKSGLAKPTGKVTITVGKTKHTKDLKAAAKGKISFSIQNLNSGKNQKVTVRFVPSGNTKKALNAKTVTVKNTPTVKATVKKTSIKKSQNTTVTVTVKSSRLTKPTGKVTVKVGSKSFSKTLKASNKGKATITIKNLNKGKNQKVTATFTPTGTAKSVLNTKTSAAKKLTVS